MDDLTQTEKRGAVLFDLDYTLWDHARAQNRAIRHLCTKHQIDFDAFLPLYERYNWDGWKAFAKGLISFTDMRLDRFIRSLEELEITHLSPSRLSEEYLAHYGNEVFLIDGAMDLLHELRRFYIIGVITNGTRDTQTKKVGRSALEGSLDFMFTVDDAGCSKPSEDFFRKAFEKAGVPSSRITCVGDNFLEDIVGATRAGAGCTIWFNPAGNPIPEQYNVRPDFVITHLSEIAPILIPVSP